MIEVIVSGVVLAAISGAAFLAYNHPIEFPKLARKSCGVLAGIMFALVLSIGGYQIGLSQARKMDPSSVALEKATLAQDEAIGAVMERVIYWSAGVVVYGIFLVKVVCPLKGKSANQQSEGGPEKPKG